MKIGSCGARSAGVSGVAAVFHPLCRFFIRGSFSSKSQIFIRCGSFIRFSRFFIQRVVFIQFRDFPFDWKFSSTVDGWLFFWGRIKQLWVHIFQNIYYFWILTSDLSFLGGFLLKRQEKLWGWKFCENHIFMWLKKKKKGSLNFEVHLWGQISLDLSKICAHFMWNLPRNPLVLLDWHLELMFSLEWWFSRAELCC